MKVNIIRTGRKIQLPSGNDVSVGSILEKHGYKHVNPLDIENYKDIEWQGIEFNRLYIKDGILHRFNEWVGQYPYKEIDIEIIGVVENIERARGWKVLKIRVKNHKVLFDIAIFGENSLVIDNYQLCEEVKENVTIDGKKKIEAEYGAELPHNFIQDMFILH